MEKKKKFETYFEIHKIALISQETLIYRKRMSFVDPAYTEILPKQTFVLYLFIYNIDVIKLGNINYYQSNFSIALDLLC